MDVYYLMQAPDGVITHALAARPPRTPHADRIAAQTRQRETMQQHYLRY
eukprot:COSAG01_NODE_72714_length_252_cov_0.679739_2_plen_48_part_01